MAQDQVQAAGAAPQKARGKNRSKGKAVAKARVRKTGTQVAITKPQPPPAPATLDQQILMVAADPRVDVAKMRELTDLRRQLRMEEAEDIFKHALAEAQREMRPIEADAANDSTKSKYATLYAVDKALRPIYSKHGISVSFNTADCPVPAHTRVLAYVERGLFTRTYQYDVAVDTKGPKGNDVMTKTHAGGSALSYGKRYLLLMVFNVTIDGGRDRDDDGNAAAGIFKIDAEQLLELIKLADEAGADKAKFCEVMKVASMADIPLKRFEEAKAQLNRKLKKKQSSDFPGDR
jgi:hypothetical protein